MECQKEASARTFFDNDNSTMCNARAHSPDLVAPFHFGNSLIHRVWYGGGPIMCMASKHIRVCHHRYERTAASNSRTDTIRYENGHRRYVSSSSGPRRAKRLPTELHSMLSICVMHTHMCWIDPEWHVTCTHGLHECACIILESDRGERRVLWWSSSSSARTTAISMWGFSVNVGMERKGPDFPTSIHSTCGVCIENLVLRLFENARRMMLQWWSLHPPFLNTGTCGSKRNGTIQWSRVWKRDDLPLLCFPNGMKMSMGRFERAL